MKSLGRITILDIRLLFLAVFVPIFLGQKTPSKKGPFFWEACPELVSGSALGKQRK
jgi:hypothetical protein